MISVGLLVQILEKALLLLVSRSELKILNFLPLPFKSLMLTAQLNIPCLNIFNLEFQVAV